MIRGEKTTKDTTCDLSIMFVSVLAFRLSGDECKLASKVLYLPSRLKERKLAIHFLARAYSESRPMSWMVSSASMTVYPIAPASVKFVPFFDIGW